ncbi:MAG: uroporphyrinogen-III C-methyltransferase [Methanotrichaceae archaeon]|nr:uroporphyrinogen-III C-methyltransferase [Methanotrichaceae archaeon]
MARGKVYLVGAGPGSPDLLTLRAKQLIDEAEVVLYDRLLNPSILEGVNAELIDVGKSAGRHSLTQEEINNLLIQKAEEGKIVVRLKGGDPYVFGRGGEEALSLRERGIPFELVPGVTSAIAAPELAGIPVTHRGISSSLTIVTGHEEPGKNSPLDWEAIARLGGTLVVLMGISRLEQNVSALIKGGKSPETLAAVVEKGGWPEQKLATGKLADIVSIAQKAEIKPPAILVVGDVVKLSEILAVKKIAILRPNGQLKESAELAESYGLKPICAPSIVLVERPLPMDLMQRVLDADCVAFTSANGVKLALKNETLRQCLATKIVVSIGPITGIALKSFGLSPEIPEEYSSEGLERMLKGRCKRVLFLRSAQGSQYLSKGLMEFGIFVDDIPLYDVHPSADPRLDKLIREAREIDIFAFTSTSTARFLVQRARELGLEVHLMDALRNATVAVIGQPTAKELERLGIRIDVMPNKFTFEAMLKTLRSYS